MKKQIKNKIDVIIAVKSLQNDIEKHQTIIHELALKNSDPADVKYFNNAVLSLELLKDIVKYKQQETLGLKS